MLYFLLFYFFKVREVVADFAVVIAIALMTVIDLVFFIGTPKLFVPDEFKARPFASKQIFVTPLLDSSFVTEIQY